MGESAEWEFLDADYVYGDYGYIPEEHMDEKWSFIWGIPEYMISNHGRVYSYATHSFLKVKPMDSRGHMGVCLCHNGKRYYEYIHRLMAIAFIPNPNNYPIVRHLDDIPDNNELENLAWGTHLDNMRDARRNGHSYILTDEDREKGFAKTRIPVKATNLSTGKVYHFRGQTDAARYFNLQQANIWKVLNGQRSSTGGYTFEYERSE